MPGMWLWGDGAGRIIAAAVLTALAQAPVPTEADLAWLQQYREEALTRLMPVAPSAGIVVYRSYRDVHYDVPEAYFAVRYLPADRGVDVKRRIVTLLVGIAVSGLAATWLYAQGGQKLPDAVTADAKHYTVEFENDIVRLSRVKIGAGESAPGHAHLASCAIEITDSSLREASGGAVSNSKAGQVFCGDATSHAPVNVGNAVAESIVVEFTHRQRARQASPTMTCPHVCAI